MHAALGAGDDVTQVFYRPGAQQRFPVRLAGGRRKGRRHHQPLHTSSLQAAIEFREAQVVADRQAQAPRGRIERHHRVARRHVRRLAVTLGAIGQLDVEQMDLVVARDPGAAGVVDQAGLGAALAGCAGQRHRTGDDPHAKLRGGAGKKFLHRARTVGLGMRAPVGVAQRHQRKILRQQREPRALVRRHLQQAPRARQVGVAIVPGTHLHGGDQGRSRLHIGGRGAHMSRLARCRIARCCAAPRPAGGPGDPGAAQGRRVPAPLRRACVRPLRGAPGSPAP